MIKNYQILKESINGIIQKSGLDIGAVYFIFKDIFRDIETLYYTQINQELMSESEKIEELSEDSDVMEEKK